MPSSSGTDCGSDGDEWDFCDSPPSATLKSSGPDKDIRGFSIFDNAVDGVKSELVKPPKKRLVTSRQPKSTFDITIIQPSLPNLRPYEQNEEKLLPASLLLASRNLLSHGQVLSAQRAVGDARPYFFYGAQMYPAILRATSNMTKSLKDMTANMTPAVVYGVRRHGLQGRPWPAANVTENPGDSIIGMLAFSLPDAEQKNLDRFQGGSSKRQVMRASFNLDDGRTAQIDCYVYVTDKSGLAVLPREEMPWRVSDLMQDPWHRQNLSSARAEEAELSLEL